MGRNNSFEKINYSLRPAKSVERKIIMKFCSHLRPFDSVENYHYIGFGSIYYSDFILFHKNLNISKMSSIEFERNESRARFNLPYKCIQLYSGESNRKLPTLIKEDEKSILWLDYDSPLSNKALDDIQTFVSKCTSGSKLLITINANADKNDCLHGDTQELYKFRIEKLKERILDTKIPHISKHLELNQKYLHILYRKIIINEIEETINKRNKAVLDNEKIIYEQILHFTYEDGAKMQTLGFVLFKKSDETNYNNCAFDTLEAFRNGEDSYHINVPKLTSTEIKDLNKMLPSTNNQIQFDEIDNSEFIEAANEYAKIYRYFPNFSESLY